MATTEDAEMHDHVSSDQHLNAVEQVSQIPVPADAQSTAVTETKSISSGVEAALQGLLEVASGTTVEAKPSNTASMEAETMPDSDFEMSDSDDSSDSESDDSSDDDSDDDMITDPITAARMLMQENAEDDDGGSSKPPRTQNEQLEKPLPIPTIPNIHDHSLLIVRLGKVFQIIPTEKCVFIQAQMFPGRKVLQPESALCLGDRTLIRPISDIVGKNEELYYASYYDSIDEINSFKLTVGTEIYYPDDKAYYKTVFYDELARQKHTDASNIHDEEVNDNEMEFSDDEAEAEYKKSKRQERQQKASTKQLTKAIESFSQQRGGRGSRGRGAPRGRGGFGHYNADGPRNVDYDGNTRVKMEDESGFLDYDGDSRPGTSYSTGSTQQPSTHLDYGDADDDDGYKKMKRPDDYGVGAAWGGRPEGGASRPARGDHENRRGGSRGDSDNRRGGYRGDRGYGRNDRGNRASFGNAAVQSQWAQQPLTSSQTPQNVVDPAQQPNQGNHSSGNTHVHGSAQGAHSNGQVTSQYGMPAQQYAPPQHGMNLPQYPPIPPPPPSQFGHPRYGTAVPPPFVFGQAPPPAPPFQPTTGAANNLQSWAYSAPNAGYGYPGHNNLQNANQGGYQSANQGGYQNANQGNYQNANQGNYQNANQGGYQQYQGGYQNTGGHQNRNGYQNTNHGRGNSGQ